jgi:hypothetical protein
MHIVLSDADSFVDRRVNRMMHSSSWCCQSRTHGPAGTRHDIASGCPDPAAPETIYGAISKPRRLTDQLLLPEVIETRCAKISRWLSHRAVP